MTKLKPMLYGNSDRYYYAYFAQGRILRHLVVSMEVMEGEKLMEVEDGLSVWHKDRLLSIVIYKPLIQDMLKKVAEVMA